MKQSVQNDSSSPLDVNAMSTVPEYPEDPDRKVSDSFTLNLYGGLQCDLSGHNGNHSIMHRATAMWQEHKVDVTA